MMQKEGMDVKETEEEKGDKEEWSFSTYPWLQINCDLKLFFFPKFYVNIYQYQRNNVQIRIPLEI